MITEYAEGGELFNYILEKNNLSEKESRNIFHQLIDAIYYLHQMGICHRDLKPENILFDTKKRDKIKIIDFGLSNLYITGLNKEELLETPCGSPGYAPPEMILGNKYKGVLTDIWSSGIILYAMICGCLPFDDESEDGLYSKIIKGEFEYPNHINISKEVKNLINKILVIDPKKRISIEEIRKTAWFMKDYKPTVGLFNSVVEIPVDDLVIEEMKKYNYEESKIKEDIKNNKHNSLTTLYYLLVKKMNKKGIFTKSDLISETFKDYIREQYAKNKLYQKIDKPVCLKEFKKLNFFIQGNTEEINKKKHKTKLNDNTLNSKGEDIFKKNINENKSNGKAKNKATLIKVNNFLNKINNYTLHKKIARQINANVNANKKIPTTSKQKNSNIKFTSNINNTFDFNNKKYKKVINNTDTNNNNCFANSRFLTKINNKTLDNSLNQCFNKKTIQDNQYKKNNLVNLRKGFISSRIENHKFNYEQLLKINKKFFKKSPVNCNNSKNKKAKSNSIKKGHILNENTNNTIKNNTTNINIINNYRIKYIHTLQLDSSDKNNSKIATKDLIHTSRALQQKLMAYSVSNSRSKSKNKSQQKSTSPNNNKIEKQNKNKYTQLSEDKNSFINKLAKNKITNNIFSTNFRKNNNNYISSPYNKLRNIIDNHCSKIYSKSNSKSNSKQKNSIISINSNNDIFTNKFNTINNDRRHRKILKQKKNNMVNNSKANNAVNTERNIPNHLDSAIIKYNTNIFQEKKLNNYSMNSETNKKLILNLKGNIIGKKNNFICIKCNTNKILKKPIDNKIINRDYSKFVSIKHNKQTSPYTNNFSNKNLKKSIKLNDIKNTNNIDIIPTIINSSCNDINSNKLVLESTNNVEKVTQNILNILIQNKIQLLRHSKNNQNKYICQKGDLKFFMEINKNNSNSFIVEMKYISGNGNFSWLKQKIFKLLFEGIN